MRHNTTIEEGRARTGHQFNVNLLTQIPAILQIQNENCSGCKMHYRATFLPTPAARPQLSDSLSLSA
jgi:hypothetical protein